MCLYVCVTTRCRHCDFKPAHVVVLPGSCVHTKPHAINMQSNLNGCGGVRIHTYINTYRRYTQPEPDKLQRTCRFGLNCEYVCIHTRNQIPFQTLPARCACTHIHAQCSCFLLCCHDRLDWAVMPRRTLLAYRFGQLGSFMGSSASKACSQ